MLSDISPALRSHHDRLRAIVRGVSDDLTDLPWAKVSEVAIGGLAEVGWSHSGGHLLVTSASGRGLFAASTGVLVARDREPHSPIWLDLERLEAQGIGDLNNERVKLAGLAGGGLPLQTSDGWAVEVHSPDWPFVDVLVCRPGCSILYELSQPSRHAVGCRRVSRCLEFRAAGFAPGGETFVVAQSDGFALWRRRGP